MDHAGGAEAPSAIEPLPPAGNRTCEMIDDHVARSGVKRDDLPGAGARGQVGNICYPADVLDGAREAAVGEHKPIRIWHERRAESSGGDVSRAEVCDCGYARTFGDHSRLSDLHRHAYLPVAVFCGIGKMADGLPVRTYEINAAERDAGIAGEGDYRIREYLTEQEVQAEEFIESHVFGV